ERGGGRRVDAAQQGHAEGARRLDDLAELELDGGRAVQPRGGPVGRGGGGGAQRDLRGGGSPPSMAASSTAGAGSGIGSNWSWSIQKVVGSAGSRQWPGFARSCGQRIAEVI